MITSNSDKEIIEKTLYDNRELLSCKQIYIFGCTMHARTIRDYLRCINFFKFEIIDNNTQKVGKICLGVEVKNPRDALIPVKNNACVIICSKYYQEMTNQLVNYGYSEKDMIIIPVAESRNNISDSLDAFEKAYEQVEKGLKKYLEIKSQINEPEKILLCPYPGTGDIYLACAYLSEYLQRNNITRYVIVVTRGVCKKVCSMFGFFSVNVVNEEEMTCLLSSWEFCGDIMPEIKPLLHWGWRCKRYIFSDNHPQISFNELFQYDVFGLDDKAQKAIPLNKETVKRNEIYKGSKPSDRIVLLSPYAGSFISEIKESTWVSIARGLERKGYSVYTNCNPDIEKPIEGTGSVFFSFENGVACLEIISGIIALRSGLCDVLSSAKSLMVVLYEEGFNAASYNFFGMVKMGLRKSDDTFEYVYNGDEDDLIRKVLSNF